VYLAKALVHRRTNTFVQNGTPWIGVKYRLLRSLEGTNHILATLINVTRANHILWFVAQTISLLLLINVTRAKLVNLSFQPVIAPVSQWHSRSVVLCWRIAAMALSSAMALCTSRTNPWAPKEPRAQSMLPYVMTAFKPVCAWMQHKESNGERLLTNFLLHKQLPVHLYSPELDRVISHGSQHSSCQKLIVNSELLPDVWVIVGSIQKFAMYQLCFYLISQTLLGPNVKNSSFLDKSHQISSNLCRLSASALGELARACSFKFS
jgi:hypothetical protein